MAGPQRPTTRTGGFHQSIAIDRDLPCTHCGYNLRTMTGVLRPDIHRLWVRCVECGKRSTHMAIPKRRRTKPRKQEFAWRSLCVVIVVLSIPATALFLFLLAFGFYLYWTTDSYFALPEVHGVTGRRVVVSIFFAVGIVLLGTLINGLWAVLFPRLSRLLLFSIAAVWVIALSSYLFSQEWNAFSSSASPNSHELAVLSLATAVGGCVLFLVGAGLGLQYATAFMRAVIPYRWQPKFRVFWEDDHEIYFYTNDELLKPVDASDAGPDLAELAEPLSSAGG